MERNRPHARRRLVPSALVLGALTVAGTSAVAQSARCNAGPGGAADSATLDVGGQTVRVCYVPRTAGSEPVFGHGIQYADRWTVSYDTLWNAQVVIQIPAPMEVAGAAIGPGVYGLYAVPSSFEWAVILTPGIEGYLADAPYDDAARANEAGRGLVRSTTAPDRTDRLTVRGEPTGSASGDLVLAWDRTEVRIPVRLTAARAALACELRGAPDRLAARASPPDSLDLTIGGRALRVCYGRPSARDRRVFGGLVPYDDMWRTGANEPTVLHIPFAAEIAGIPVDAGDYALMAIPSQGNWVIVVNAATNRWGRVTPTERGGTSYYVDAVRAQEVGRAMVPSARTAAHVERFTITGESDGPAGATLVLEWERTSVRVPIRLRP